MSFYLFLFLSGFLLCFFVCCFILWSTFNELNDFVNISTAHVWHRPSLPTALHHGRVFLVVAAACLLFARLHLAQHRRRVDCVALLHHCTQQPVAHQISTPLCIDVLLELRPELQLHFGQAPSNNQLLCTNMQSHTKQNKESQF